jgi:hypothetical protein
MMMIVNSYHGLYIVPHFFASSQVSWHVDNEGVDRGSEVDNELLPKHVIQIHLGSQAEPEL